MDEEEIQQIIIGLRRALVDNGFGWIVDDAEAELYSGVTPRTRALALIDAAEGGSVTLAELELSTLDALAIESVEFKPDEEGEPGRDELSRRKPAGEAILDADYHRSARRRAKLEQLAEQRFVFEVLRRRLNGDE